MRVSIVNVVATAALGQSLDFDELKEHEEIFHDSRVYGGRVAYYKAPSMEGRVSIFRSGKMISVGAKTEKKAFQQLHLAMNFLTKKGFVKPVELDFRTRNIVVTADFGKSLNLEKLAENSKAIYEPEQFPGAILRIDKPSKASVLVFASGKIVITGLTKQSQIIPTINRLKSLTRSL
jgi:transcription initiation factor TFIID TATA-box-binding protein